MSSMLINDPKYSWLKDLDLGPTNKGVFYGVWDGTGEVYSVFIVLLKWNIPVYLTWLLCNSCWQLQIIGRFIILIIIINEYYL